MPFSINRHFMDVDVAPAKGLVSGRQFTDIIETHQLCMLGLNDNRSWKFNRPENATVDDLLRLAQQPKPDGLLNNPNGGKIQNTKESLKQAINDKIEEGYVHFVLSYVGQYLRERLRGRAHDEAYRAISYEVDARRDTEDVVAS